MDLFTCGAFQTGVFFPSVFFFFASVSIWWKTCCCSQIHNKHAVIIEAKHSPYCLCTVFDWVGWSYIVSIVSFLRSIWNCWNNYWALHTFKTLRTKRVVCGIWEEFHGRGMAVSICEIRGGSIISVTEHPPTTTSPHLSHTHTVWNRGDTVKWEEKKGLLHSSREPVLIAQSFYEGLRISVGVFLGVWLVGKEQNLADKTIWFELWNTGIWNSQLMRNARLCSLCICIVVFPFFFPFIFFKLVCYTA